MTSRLTFRAALSCATALALVGVLTTPATAQKKTTPQKPKNETKGQNQMAGGLVKFGEIYSLQGGFNFQILKARYTMEPFSSYGSKLNGRETKLVVFDIALKNFRPEANDKMNQQLFSIIDSTGKKYDGELQLKSFKCRELYINLKPGQGLGQTALNDPLQMAFEVPLDAVITKVMVNQPRLNVKEEVLRYLIAGSDKLADPANVIAPLPDDVAAPDSKGTVAKPEGTITIGKPFYSGYYTYTVDKVETSGKLSDSYDPGEGKKYLILTLTTKNAYGKQLGYFDSIFSESVLVDGDGDKVPLTVILKKSSAGEVSTQYLEDGETLTTRLVFTINSDQKVKAVKLIGGRYPWMLPVSN